MPNKTSSLTTQKTIDQDSVRKQEPLAYLPTTHQQKIAVWLLRKKILKITNSQMTCFCGQPEWGTDTI